MNISAWSIRNPIPTAMLFVLLTIGGLLSLRAMKIQNFPDIDFPTVTVTVSLPGAAPEQLETDVARKLENSIATVSGLKHLNTKIRDGSVLINASFVLERSLQQATDDVRSAVARVRGELPADIQEPIVSKEELASQAILGYTVAQRQRPGSAAPAMDQEALSWFVDNELKRALLAVPGVGAVTRVGGVSRQVQVQLDPLRLQAMGVTALEISRQLRQIQTENAGGRTDLGGTEQPLRMLATVQTAQQLAALELTLANGRQLRLRDVATVTDGVAEPRSSALLNGRAVVGFEISRSRGAGEIDVGRGVSKVLAALQADTQTKSTGLEFHETFNFVQGVQEEYDASMQLLYEGAVLAVLVVWLFLRDWRATLVSAVALPMSVIPAFVAMYLLGYSLNVISMLALSLVVGILVDDAIVEVENIVRHLRMGKTAYQAAMDASEEIGLAVVATTFTLIAVFLPTAFMSGIVGRFFKQFGWTASIAVFASLVVARMLTPMMAAYLLKPIVGEHREPFWMARYLRLASWCMRHRLATMASSLAFFAGSLALIPLLPTGFLPADDMSLTQVTLELPPGTTLAQTQAAAEQARQALRQLPAVTSIYTVVGAQTAGESSADANVEINKATLTLRLQARGARPSRQVLENQMREVLHAALLAGVRYKVGLGGSGEKYVLVLSAGDAMLLQQVAQNVSAELRQVPGLGMVTSSAGVPRNEVIARPDFARAADLGVTSSAIGDTLRVATIGDYDVALPKLNLAQRQVPVLVKLDPAARANLQTLEQLAVPSARLGTVPLGQVATLEMQSGGALIERYNRQRNINLEIELSGMPLGDVAQVLRTLPSMQHLPPGVKVNTSGDAESMDELFAGFGLAMLIGVLCIYVVLVLLFKGLLHPLTILAALPLSFGGAFLGLLMAQQSFSMPSLIGVVMLMGIATKNSILLVEYAIVARRDQGLSRRHALLAACRKRAQPILMTSLAMGAGMLPIALGWSAADPSFRSPMAVAVIGGLITSTLLSLLVIGPVFSYMEDVGNWCRKLAGRW
ncbi:efflux RND transporter permease subunit [Herbaspirillum autotrophicum]|uniref:efflux RND transporter permease subunit n=1 Tax=Herbaspirillum autotrophicum TaxID=180195 RepID=UPI00067BAFB0|nr:efflux RND transporter permease subunit [Herbaspirillum autotrophicum]